MPTDPPEESRAPRATRGAPVPPPATRPATRGSAAQDPRADDRTEIESIVQRHDEEQNLPRRKLVRARPPATDSRVARAEAGTPDLEVLRRKFLGADAADAADDDDCGDDLGSDAAEPAGGDGDEPADDDDDVAAEQFQPEEPDLDEPGHDPRVVLVSKARKKIIGEQG